MADGAIDKLSIEIGASSTKAITSIKRLAEQLGSLRDAVAGEDGSTARKLNSLAKALNNIKSVGTVSIGNKLPEQLRNISAAVSEVTSETISKLDEMTKAIERLKGIDLRGFSNAVKAAKKASGEAQSMMNVAQPIKKDNALVPLKNDATMQDIYDMVHRDFMSGQTETGGGTAIQEAGEKAKEASHWFEKLKEAAQRSSKGMEDMGKSAKKASGPLGNFLGALKRIAMYRLMRTIIKAITQAFQEGLQNAYIFSAGMTNESHRFAAAMDSMKSAGLQMKNQLGSAFIALLTAIMPVINAIIAAVTKLADAMSQFFAVFTGGRYLKANAVSQQFADTMGSGAKAAEEWKNQLMGFDVINRLEAPADRGGGGGTAAANPADMFQDAEIDGIFAKMKQKLDELKNSLNFEPLKAAWDHLKEAVKGFADVVMTYLAAAWDKILVPLAKWTIQEVAPRLVELLAKAFEFLTAVLERLKPVFKWIWEHILEPIAKFVGDAFLKFLDSVIDLIGKLTDLISGKTTFGEFLKSLSPGQAILLGIATALIVVNGAISLFSGIVSAVTLVVGGLSAALTFLLSPIGLVIIAITALIAIGVALYQNWDTIKEKFRQAGEDLRGDWERTKEFFSQTADSMKQIGTNLVDSLKEQFHQIGEDLRGDLERAKSMVQGAVAQIKSVFEGAKAAILNVFNGIRAGIQNIINSIISMIQRLAQSIKNLFSSIGSLGGAFNIVGMPQYASGGFPEDGLFMANHGEMVGRFSNGKTAVANNQEITAGIARAVYDAFTAAISDVGSGGGGGKNTEFVLNINGKEFARAIYNDQRAVARERGVSLVTKA